MNKEIEENCSECNGTGRRNSGSQEFEACSNCRGIGTIEVNPERRHF